MFLDHATVATGDMPATVAALESKLGISFGPPTRTIPGIAGRIARLRSGFLEVMEVDDSEQAALAPFGKNLAAFLDVHGAGVFSLTLETPDLDAFKAALPEGTKNCGPITTWVPRADGRRVNFSSLFLGRYHEMPWLIEYNEPPEEGDNGVHLIGARIDVVDVAAVTAEFERVYGLAPVGGGNASVLALDGATLTLAPAAIDTSSGMSAVDFSVPGAVVRLSFPDGELHLERTPTAVPPPVRGPRPARRAAPAGSVGRTAGPQQPNYVHLLLDALADQAASTVLRWGDDDITADVLRRSIEQQAATLARAGIGPGDVVAVLTAQNSPLQLTVRYAAHLAGAAVAYVGSMNPAGGDRLPADVQADMVRSSGARLLAFDASSADAAQRAVAATSVPLARVDLEVRAGDAGADAAPDFPAGSDDDLAMIVYTSGSSGEPKGIRMSYRAWSHVETAARAGVWPGEQVRMLAVTPVGSTVGPMVDAVLTSGGFVMLEPGFDAKRVLAAVSEQRISRIFLAVSHLYQLLDYPGLDHIDLSSIRQIMYGGTCAAPRRLTEAVAVFGNVLVQGYGTSEGGRISYLHPGQHLDHTRLGTAGQLFPEVEIEIRDTDTGQALPAGAVGEIWTRSPQVMDGYQGRPELTAQVLVGGWYRTGDLGCIDADGYVQVLDRLDEVAKIAGTKVYPGAVEARMCEVDGVAQAVVFGVEDADRTEHLMAVVVTRPGRTLDPDALVTHVRECMSDAHVAEMIDVVDTVPLNVAGKPDKVLLRARYRGALLPSH